MQQSSFSSVCRDKQITIIMFTLEQMGKIFDDGLEWLRQNIDEYLSEVSTAEVVKMHKIITKIDADYQKGVLAMNDLLEAMKMVGATKKWWSKVQL